jgi:hypothetical protein
MRHQAIRALYPSVVTIDHLGTYDKDGNSVTITESDVSAKQAELQTAHDAKAYARARADAYPNIQDFKEAYTEKEIGGDSTKWDAYVIAYNKVRTDNPK